MDRPDASAAGACKYLIAERLGQWRVRRDEADAGSFASLDDAVHFACGQARERAKAGILGVVVVQSEVREMHCFTPSADVQSASRAPLRLVRGAD
jgi:hypothetical protein